MGVAGAVLLPSWGRAAHAFRPGLHGDRTRSASAAALARPPGLAPTPRWRRRGPGERQVQVTVPLSGSPAALSPLCSLAPLWRVAGGSCQCGKCLEEWREEVSSTWKRGATPSQGTSRVAPRKPSLSVRSVMGTVGSRT